MPKLTTLQLLAASEAQGDILIRTAAGWARLAAGAAGKFLQSNGPGADPTYETAGGGGSPKAGFLDVASISGTPATGAVVFNTAFGDNNYAVTVTPETSAGNTNLVPQVQSKSAAGFTIYVSAGNITSLLGAHWIATPNSDP